MIVIAGLLVTLSALGQTQFVYAPQLIPARFLHHPYFGFFNNQHELNGRNYYLPRIDTTVYGNPGGRAPSANPASTLPLNSMPESRKLAKVVVKQSSVSSVVSPVCLACTCLSGFRSCSAAGGRQFIEYACLGDGTVGSECTFPAPDSLSACDPTCKLTCKIVEDGLYPLITDCTDIDPINQLQCVSACGNLPVGATVKCDSNLIGIMTGVPSVCSARNQRDLGSSMPEVNPEVEETNSAVPEIASSQTSPTNRQSRLFGIGGLLAHQAKLNLFGTSNVNFTTGRVTATYVISNQTCIPSALANASLCV